MDAPDELVDAVAEVLWNGDSEPFISWANVAEPVKEMQRDAARRVLAVPAIADALRAAERDAKVAKIVAEWLGSGSDPWPMTRALEHTIAIAALYPEATS